MNTEFKNIIMVRSKKIDQLSSVGRLGYIREQICNISEKRIETAVLSLKTNDSIEGLLRIFANLNNVFSGEEEILLENERRHNELYANEDNGKYSTAYAALCCIKKSVYGLYRVLNCFKKTDKPSYCYQSDTKDIEFIVDHSQIGTLPTEGYLFKDKSPRQQRLISEIMGFLHFFARNLKRCEDIVNEEMEIGKNEEACRLRLDRQIDEIYQIVKGNKIGKSTEQFVIDLLNVDERPEYATKYWHILKPSQLKYVVIEKKKQNLSSYSVNTQKAFDYDEEKMCLFQNIVKTMIDKSWKINGELMAYAQLYSNCTASKLAFYNAFSDTYSDLGGSQELIGYPGYAKTFKVYCDRNAAGYREFERNMDLNMA